MAVTSVGDRPQAPVPTEAPNVSAQKSGGRGDTAVAGAQAASAKAEVTAQLQADRAADAFVPAAAKAEVAIGAEPVAQDAAFGFADPAAADAAAAKQPPANTQEALQNLDQALEDVKNLPPDAPIEQVFDTFVGALDSVLDLMNSVLQPQPETPPTPPGQSEEPSVTNPNPLGIEGPGGPGTQPGAFGVVGIDQKDPNLDGQRGIYNFGQTNCGPTSMAQIARGKALQDPNYSMTWTDGNGQQVTKKVADMTNEELVSTLGQIGKTDGEGTSPLGIIDMANALGLNVDDSEVMYDKNWREGQPSNSFNEQWLTDQLANGKKVVVNGAYEAQGADGKTQLVGHYMTIAGQNADGTFAVVDPWDGKVKNYSAADLAKFMQANPSNGGVMLAMG